MADKETDTVIRNPNRRRFWTFRNISLLATTAFLPVVGKAAWEEAQEFTTGQAALRERMLAGEEQIKDLHERLQDKAVWSAITEIKNEQVRMHVELGVLQKLFDREFARAAPMGPSTESESRSKRELQDALDKLKGMESFKLDQYRDLLQQKNPSLPLPRPAPAEKK